MIGPETNTSPRIIDRVLQQPLVAVVSRKLHLFESYYELRSIEPKYNAVCELFKVIKEFKLGSPNILIKVDQNEFEVSIGKDLSMSIIEPSLSGRARCFVSRKSGNFYIRKLVGLVFQDLKNIKDLRIVNAIFDKLLNKKPEVILKEVLAESALDHFNQVYGQYEYDLNPIAWSARQVNLKFKGIAYKDCSVELCGTSLPGSSIRLITAESKVFRTYYNVHNQPSMRLEAYIGITQGDKEPGSKPDSAEYNDLSDLMRILSMIDSEKNPSLKFIRIRL